MPSSFGNLHKYELNKNKTNGHIKVDEVNLLVLISVIHIEVLATEEAGKRRGGKSATIGYHCLTVILIIVMFCC